MKTKTTVATILLIVLTLTIFTPTFVLTCTKASAAPSAASSRTGDYTQVDVFGGTFSSQSISVVPYQTVDVSFSICPTVDAPGTTIQFFMPSDVIKLVKGELLWTGDVKKGETITLQLSITAESDFVAGIRALVEAPPQYTSSYYLSVSTMSGARYGGGNSLPATRMNPSTPSTTPSTTPSKPLPQHRLLNSTASAPSVNMTASSWTFYGYWYFYSDEKGYDIPMDNFYIEIWDRHWYGDSNVGYGWTDNNGYYSITVSPGESLMSPYVRAYAQDGWFSYAVDGSIFSNHYYSYTSLPDSTPPGVYNVGSWAAVTDYQAFQAVHGVEAEGSYVYWNSGASYMRSWVEIHWPDRDWPQSTGDDMYLPSSWGWGHTTVQHEYGHCIMWALYGNNFPPTAYGGASHYVWDEFDGGFAITEGWAEFMACAVDGNPNNLQGTYNGHGGNIETNDWYNCIDTGDMDGNNIEGSCASILWDILDTTSSADKDYLSMGYAPIFGILRDYNPGSMASFFWDWVARYPDLATSKGPLSTIYWHYGIDEDWYAPWGSITINSGAAYTNSRTVTLTLDGEDWGSGVYYMRFSTDVGATWSAWYYYATSCSWTLPAGDGWKWVDVQYADLDWHTSGAGTIYDGIGLDTTPPTGSININSGATYTSSRWVTLTLSASDTYSGVAYMRFSEDLGVTWGSWYSYATSWSFYLSTSGDGHKWVDVQYEDNAGNPTAAGTIYHGIYLDTTPPTGSIVINSGNPAYTTTTSVTLYLSYYDATSGVYKVRYSNDGTSWTAWENPAATRAWNLTSGDGSKTAYYELEDNVGWISLVYSDGIVFDTVAPVTTISHSAGSSTVSLSATDATSGVYASYYRIDLSSWITYAGSFTLAGTGTHAIDYYSKDNAGNTETMKSLTVYYLTVNTDPSGVTTISGTGWYNKGTTAKTGTAPGTVISGSTLYTFSTWKKDGTAVSGNPINVLVDAAHTATAFYTVSAFSFSVSASPSTKTIVAGGSATYNVTAKLLGGTSQSISWSISGLPSGASATFTPTSGLPTFSSTLKITTSATTPLGAYTLTVTGTGLSSSKSVTITLRILNYTVSPTPFSPNADGTKDNTTAKATFWTSLTWTLTVKNSSGQVVRNLASGTSASLAVLWDGKDGSGKTVPDGTYTVVLASPSFNTQTKTVVVDTKLPTATGHWTPNLFNPHINQTSLLTYTLSEKCTVTIRIYDASNKLVKTLQASTSKAAGTYTIVWNGTNSTNGVVTAGTYTCRIYATDTAGNTVNPPIGYIIVTVKVL